MGGASGTGSSSTVTWQEAFRTGIGPVDDEHRLLFQLVASLDAGAVQQAISQLTAYVEQHFAREEGLMQASHYPDLDEHRRQHRHLAERVCDYHASTAPWPPERVEQLRGFLTTWLEAHILIHDLAFGRWYAAAGAPVPG